MNLANLATQTLEKIKTYRFDRIVEKHESSESWESFLRYYDLEFLQFNGHNVLLPVDREHHPNITLLRCIDSADGQSLTLFLKDTTYSDDPFIAGFLAVCASASGGLSPIAFPEKTFSWQWFTTSGSSLMS